MKLSHDEEIFLRHWVYDEMHYQHGQGPAKRLQVEHQISPADIAAVVAAAIPDPREQEAAAMGPPPAEPPIWPWSDGSSRQRVSEAQALLAQRRNSQFHPAR